MLRRYEANIYLILVADINDTLTVFINWRLPGVKCRFLEFTDRGKDI